MLLLLVGVLHAETKHEKFISVADIHFDPFVMCKGQKKPCQFLLKLKKSSVTSWEKIFDEEDDSSSEFLQDTNYSLLKNTIQELKKIKGQVNPQFVLVLGDLLSHDFRASYKKYSNNSLMGYQDFVKKTMAFLALEIKKPFPDVEVFPVIGNNDSYHGDYYSDPYGLFYKDCAAIWSTLMTKTSQQFLKKDFSAGGYYALTLPNFNNLKLIMLNSVLFSTYARGKHIDIAAQRELKWLEHELILAQKHHQKVLIAMHIPLGIDFYTALQTRFSKVQEFWRMSYSREFRDQIKRHASVISGLLPAHIHYDVNQLILFNQPSDIPINFTASISPIFGNTPSFKVFTFDTTTFLLTDEDTYYLSLKTKTPFWKKKHTAKLLNTYHKEYCSLSKVIDLPYLRIASFQDT